MAARLQTMASGRGSRVRSCPTHRSCWPRTTRRFAPASPSPCRGGHGRARRTAPSLPRPSRARLRRVSRSGRRTLRVEAARARSARRPVPAAPRGRIRARGDGDDRDRARRHIAVGEVRVPEGVSLHEVTSRADLERIAALEQAVWGDEDQRGWLIDMLESERTADPRALTIVVAEAGRTVACAAWIRFEQDTEFATLWGGATLPEWRRRGIYRATVAYRARLAADRGYRYLETDASDDSRPILERLGFTAVTTTTPYVWSPSTIPAAEP